MSALGLSLGYTSKSAFSNAFKRIVEMAPKRYRDTMRAGDTTFQFTPSTSSNLQLLYLAEYFSYQEYAGGDIFWYFDEHQEDASEIISGQL